MGCHRGLLAKNRPFYLYNSLKNPFLGHITPQITFLPPNVCGKVVSNWLGGRVKKSFGGLGTVLGLYGGFTPPTHPELGKFGLKLTTNRPTDPNSRSKSALKNYLDVSEGVYTHQSKGIIPEITF